MTMIWRWSINAVNSWPGKVTCRQTPGDTVVGVAFATRQSATGRFRSSVSIWYW